MTFKAEIVFVRMLLPLVIGIFCAYQFPYKDFIDPALLFTGLLFLYLIITNYLYKTFKVYRYKGINGLVFYIFCFAFGFSICLLNNNKLREDYFGKQNYEYLKVWVNNEPQQVNDILRFEVKVSDAYYKSQFIKSSGKLLIALKLDSLYPLKLKYGDGLMITSKYLPVEPAYNIGEFNFKSWLGSKNVYEQTFINQFQIVKFGKGKGNFIINYALNERIKQVAVFRKLIKNDEAFAVASTLVLGYRANLDKETLSAYSKTGTIHALSVSGAHVGIIFLLLNGMLAFMERKKVTKIIKLILICSLIWYYSLLTGFSSSVLRSAIMLTIFILAKAFNRNSNHYNILAFTAFCLLIYNPFFIVDVGFQLSFVSVFGLIYLQPKIYKWIYVKNKWLDKLWAAVALSLAAQLVTFPLSVYYFHQFPVYFLIGNLFILLPLIAMMYLGIGILVLRVYFLGPVFEWVITATNNGLKFISELPFSGITSIWLNPCQFLLLSFSLILIVISLVNYKKRLLIYAISLLIIYQSYSTYSKFLALKQHKILFFSLRKNYAAAFIDAGKAILVTDLNSENKNFQFFVKPGLDSLKVTEIFFVKWDQDTLVNSFIKSEHQIKFKNYNILLLDSSFNYKQILNQPRFEALWLHNNPKSKLENLKNQIHFNTVLIDASNKDYKIDQFKLEANKIGISHHIFKKNNSYLIDLNLKTNHE